MKTTITITFAVVYGLCSVLAGQTLSTYSRLLDGGSIEFETNEKGEVYSITFSGDPKWVIAQADERADWRKYSTLKEIVLIQTEVNKELMEYVASLTSVVVLDITDTEVIAPGETLEPLGKMKWLKRLSIDDIIDAEPTHWKFISRLQSLEALIIDDPSISQADLDLTSLKSLKLLSLPSLSKDSAKQLSGLTELETLYLERAESPTAVLTALVGHAKLKELALIASRSTPSDLDLITQIPNLEDLDLLSSKAFSLSDLSAIARISKLKRLILNARALESISPFSKCKNLESLALYLQEFPASENLTTFGELKKLKELRLSCHEYPGLLDCGPIANLPQLECLKLDARVVKRYSLEGLRGHPSIRSLSLSGVEFQDQDLEILASIPNLETLTVGNHPNSRWSLNARKHLTKVRLSPSSPAGTGSW